MLKAEKSVLFLQNKEIDHLYSLSLSTETTQNAGQFTMNSIRMKSNLGLAGKAWLLGWVGGCARVAVGRVGVLALLRMAGGCACSPGMGVQEC